MSLLNDPRDIMHHKTFVLWCNKYLRHRGVTIEGTLMDAFKTGVRKREAFFFLSFFCVKFL